GVHIVEQSPVLHIDSAANRASIQTRTETYHANRVLLATGAWALAMSHNIGRPLPINVRINTVSVTERMPRVIHHVIGHASGLLTMKQSANGTILIGGGWQGRGTPEGGRGEVVPATLVSNLRLAQYAVPGLAKARLVRAWTGFEAHTPDFSPLAGL